MHVSDRLLTPEEILIAECAAEARRVAPSLCTNDPETGERCSWYHGFWPYLHALGIVVTPDTHSSFYEDSFRALAAKPGFRRVLISGSADFNMLQRVYTAFDAAGETPEVVFLDRCPTPVALAEWYATRMGRTVDGRLADMLGSARPDIPILVVLSATDATLLNSAPGIDFSNYPQILASPPVARPADFYELTKILLVPSVFREPVGTVAAEAMLNGITALVSDRGGLPDTVADAGTVLPLPDWLTPETKQIVEIEDAQPWFDAVCTLWDDQDAYQTAAAKARDTADRLYAEPVLKARYIDYIEGLCPELYLPSADLDFDSDDLM